jgi:hypothetical protein
MRKKNLKRETYWKMKCQVQAFCFLKHPRDLTHRKHSCKRHEESYKMDPLLIYVQVEFSIVEEEAK